MAGNPVWAVHINDGVLGGWWLVGGFVVAGLLVAWAARKVPDEEIPRIALLSAAFFVASLLHLRLGPTSIHLLLNGLVGVVLGRRAPLAILLGLLLQAIIWPGHGGFTTLGVNTCVLALPALVAWGLFTLLRRTNWLHGPVARTLLAAGGTFAGLLGAVFFIALIATNRWGDLLAPDPTPAARAAGSPAALACAGLLAILCGWGERRLRAGPELALGFVAGAVAVALTVGLNALALLWGGNEDWHTIVTVVVAAHLPLVVIEGLVVGYAVAFLARVKPELLGMKQMANDAPSEAGPAHVRPPALLLALVCLGSVASPAQAHRLLAEYGVLPSGQVQVESWFDITGDSPQGATVQVFGTNGELVTEGHLDDKGRFVFTPPAAETLRIVVNGGPGHRAELKVTADTLRSPVSATPATAPGAPVAAPTANREARFSPKDVLLGVTFLLALAAFVLSVRNARQPAGQKDTTRS